MPKYKIEECSNCSYETKCQYVEYKRPDGVFFEGWLCEVCRKNFFAQNVFYYPSQHLEDGNIIKMIAWGINYLRDEIKMGKGNKVL